MYYRHSIKFYFISLLEEEIEKITTAINMKSRSIVHVGKTFLYEQLDLDTSTAYLLGTEKMVNNLKMKDAQEGIKSFIEKRKPVWRHDYEKYWIYVYRYGMCNINFQKKKIYIYIYHCYKTIFIIFLYQIIVIFKNVIKYRKCFIILYRIKCLRV